jgi:hypothetical protein
MRSTPKSGLETPHGTLRVPYTFPTQAHHAPPWYAMAQERRIPAGLKPRRGEGT